MSITLSTYLFVVIAFRFGLEFLGGVLGVDDTRVGILTGGYWDKYAGELGDVGDCGCES